MTVSFQKTEATVVRGRSVKPIPAEVMAAIETALTDKTNVQANNLTDAEAHDLQNAFNRLRRKDATVSFMVSIRDDETHKGKKCVLVADVKRVKPAK